MKNEQAKYRPETGIEGAEFMMMHCRQCRHDVDCAIPAKTLLFTVHEDRYPDEWIVEEDGGMPTCTKFEWDQKQKRGKRKQEIVEKNG